MFFLAILITINSSLSCVIFTHRMKHILTLVLFVTMCGPFGYSQADIPGAKAFIKAFGTDTELNLEKCCFAAYGWHIAEEVKNEGIQLGKLYSDDVAFELLISAITPQISEQYFTTPDGEIVVVSSQAQFEKVLGRFLVNVDASN